MQFCNINNKIVDYVFDKSSLKQGCFTPGTNIKIKNPVDIKNKYSIFVITILEFEKEIIKQEKILFKKGENL